MGDFSLRRLTAIALLIPGIGCHTDPAAAPGAADAGGGGTMAGGAAGSGTVSLTSAKDLAVRLDDDRWQIVDVRSSADFEAGHVPGSLHLDAGSLRATVDAVGGQVAPRDTVTAALAAAGVEPGKAITTYGDDGGLAAARVLWTLEYHGHTGRLAKLDGGFQGWVTAEGATEAGSRAATSSYTAGEPRPEVRVDKAWVLDHLDDAAVVFVDARTAGEFASGRIPGARHVNWMANVDDAGKLRPRAEVQALYAGAEADQTLVAYCQTGSRASMTYFALRWLGYADVRLYDGSWAEYGADPETPKERD